MNTYTYLWEVINRSNTINEIRDAIILAIEQGTSKENLLKALEKLRETVDDTQEDTILDVMDFLTGWSSPHMRID